MTVEMIYSVSGIVQGVGFRPLCVRIAHRCDLRGSVTNTSDGVLLKLQGQEDDVARFLDDLRHDCPDVAMIVAVKLISQRAIDVRDNEFIIEKSVRAQRQRVLLPPDMATCPDCLADIRDPKDRRYRYPFTNCTNCGPRFSIVRSLPYDRPCTTMVAFPMCPNCHREYTDEENRRFHAQPNACPVCGPHLTYCDASKEVLSEHDDALKQAASDLKSGLILAIKGLGGFHLVCDARNERAVALLRERKRRPRRPFAVMMKDLDEAKSYVDVTPDDAALLSGSRAPILLLPKLAEKGLAPSLAPGLKRLGVMLPYTPLHHLLLDEISPLVMTSANLSGDPLVSGNDEAFSRLAGICDRFLIHNRDIHMKIDDSVLLPAESGPILIRRARGYVPNPVITGHDLAPVLAAGAEMKGTFAFSQDNMIFPSQYLGDLKELHSGEFYVAALRHFASLYNFAPELLAHDLHPQFIPTRIAKRNFPALPCLAIQHHYAHMMACLAEHQTDDPALGLIMDGTGYGSDGTVWGGEILYGNSSGFKRLGSLHPFRLPGGDRAVIEVWRCGFSLLVETFGAAEALELCARLWPKRASTAAQLLRVWGSFPVCSSCGRLFDGVASLVMAKEAVSYDGEAAMELEALSDESVGASGVMDFDGVTGQVTWQPFVRDIVRRERPAAEVGGAFHAELATALARAAGVFARQNEASSVALSGGCWQNGHLLKKMLPLLRAAGLIPLTHRTLSPNDESVSVGQAYIAGLRLQRGDA